MVVVLVVLVGMACVNAIPHTWNGTFRLIIDCLQKCRNGELVSLSFASVEQCSCYKK